MQRFCLAACLAAALQLASFGALAYDPSVRQNCKSDYLAHCSQHPLGSDSLRACMRGVGAKLQPGCISALIKSGEVRGTKASAAVQPAQASVDGGTKGTKSATVAPITKEGAGQSTQAGKTKKDATSKQVAKGKQNGSSNKTAVVSKGATGKSANPSNGKATQTALSNSAGQKQPTKFQQGRTSKQAALTSNKLSKQGTQSAVTKQKLPAAATTGGKQAGKSKQAGTSKGTPSGKTGKTTQAKAKQTGTSKQASLKADGSSKTAKNKKGAAKQTATTKTPGKPTKQGNKQAAKSANGN